MLTRDEVVERLADRNRVWFIHQENGSPADALGDRISMMRASSRWREVSRNEICRLASVEPIDPEFTAVVDVPVEQDRGTIPELIVERCVPVAAAPPIRPASKAGKGLSRAVVRQEYQPLPEAELL